VFCIIRGQIPEGKLSLGVEKKKKKKRRRRKQVEQARESKPVQNIPPWSLHQLLLPDPLKFQY
jgi:hypothetical protein